MSTTIAYNALIRDIPMPSRIARLPVSPEGFPTPFFVAVQPDGSRDFRVIDGEFMVRCVKHKRCWVCGEPLGRNFAFVLGPMCVINRTISEPPSHLDCALYAVQACPFLANPRMRRNEKNMPEDGIEAAGVGLKRNPGASAVWITRSYKPFKVDNGVLFEPGDPEQVLWYASGRLATRAEVMASIASGFPVLAALAEEEGPAAARDLGKKTVVAMNYVPE